MKSHMIQCRVRMNYKLYENVTTYPVAPSVQSASPFIVDAEQEAFNSFVYYSDEEDPHVFSSGSYLAQNGTSITRESPIDDQQMQITPKTMPNKRDLGVIASLVASSRLSTFDNAWNDELNLSSVEFNATSATYNSDVTHLFVNESERTNQAINEPVHTGESTLNPLGEDTEDSEIEGEIRYSNRTDHCAYYFTDRSCPWPTVEEMQQIDIVCEALEIQMDFIFCTSLVFGVPGSILIVVTVSSMEVNPTALYMKLLAISDFLSLVLGVQMFKMPNVGNFTIDDLRPMWLCRLFQAFSNWNVAMMCLERFVSVQFPMKKNRIYTMRNTRKTGVAAFLLSATPFVWSCLHYAVYDYTGHMALHLNIVHNLIYSLIPGTFIVIFSTLTAIQLKKGVIKRRSMMESTAPKSSSKLEAVLTRMMFVISICFVVINSPWGAIHVFDNLRMLFCPFTEAVYSFFYYGCLSFTFVNHAINFYVYYAFAKGFRNRFWHIIRCRQNFQEKHSASQSESQ
ncbi:hypothetical protein RRG08_010996 [Elysia crispata]|uniref:G-protein coupled receptors family 1 profile domain-containing protein n=1 Tax=Elysia crispata TaxID=231223 RepID=A0AAE0ZSG0_9GAST|nr:hypothetical protein RRG08_010996 [Elysia crispata]